MGCPPKLDGHEQKKNKICQIMENLQIALICHVKSTGHKTKNLNLKKYNTVKSVK